MPSRRKNPTQAPPHDRSISLGRLQLIGVPLLAAIPILGSVGAFGLAAQEVFNPVARIAFIYFFLMLAIRIMGKREMSEMSPFELVTLLMVPEIFSSTLSKEQYSMAQSTVGVATLFTLVFITGLVTFRFRRVEQAVEGQPRILATDGELLEDNLKRERVTADEVLAEAHKAGLESIDDVRWAILEVDGKISIIPKTPQPTRQRDEHKA